MAESGGAATSASGTSGSEVGGDASKEDDEERALKEAIALSLN